ncbi:MAG: alpha/beta hydrolase [Hyphomonadaceae bacterium JAD_PAG50586_4]|nr:MAG: alpha/beta hydrolase [Hyphomonadaceae bacterium JAD_PAG50586_4]
MPFTIVNGVNHFFQEHGAGGEIVWFTHGILFSSDMFAPQYQALRADYRCIGMDWRGQGRTDTPLGGYDVDNLANDALALMDRLGIDRVHWVGLSIGGVVGVRLAAEHPERIASLSLIGAAADDEPRDKLARYEQLFEIMEKQGLAAAAATVLPILFGPDFLSDPAREPLREDWIQRICSNDGARMRRAAAPILRRRDIRYMLPFVRCPTLVCTGEYDKANGPDRARILAEGIEGARLTIIPRAGHTATLEEPKATSEALRAFLGSVNL